MERAEERGPGEQREQRVHRLAPAQHHRFVQRIPRDRPAPTQIPRPVHAQQPPQRLKLPQHVISRARRLHRTSPRDRPARPLSRGSPRRSRSAGACSRRSRRRRWPASRDRSPSAPTARFPPIFGIPEIGHFLLRRHAAAQHRVELNRGSEEVQAVRPGEDCRQRPARQHQAPPRGDQRGLGAVPFGAQLPGGNSLQAEEFRLVALQNLGLAGDLEGSFHVIPRD